MLLRTSLCCRTVETKNIFAMNSKQNLEDIDNICTKRARLTDELSNEDVIAPEKGVIGPPCSAKDESQNVQSHGESTDFRAITEVNGDDDSELSDFGFECFDDLDSPERQNRQPVAGNVDQLV